jgi:hypothetical protein
MTHKFSKSPYPTHRGYYVITRVVKGKKYASHWEADYDKAKKSADEFKKSGVETRIVKSQDLKSRYDF